ncbi:MAG TPA: hypothetical protein VG148_15135 [Pyrinomonadaceae bacterium]|nr:hypothetical protein [Pyrinomonadaceae bacterium]
MTKDGFYVIYFAADEDLDPNDLIYTDLLLSIARRVVEQTTKDEINIGDALKTVETWFAEVVFQESDWKTVEAELKGEAQLGLGLAEDLPLVGRLLARLTGQIKTGHEVKEQIRTKLDSRVSQLLVGLNDLLMRTEVEVHRKGMKGIAVIVDNLDRVTYKDLGNGRTSHDALFIEHGDQLRALRCHTVYTVPISMIYGLSARNLDNIFTRRHVLPMIKTHEPRAKGGGDCVEGLARLREIIGQRIDIGTLFGPEAVAHLCRASGGHPRDLMRLVRQSIEDTDEGPPVTLAAVKRAESSLISDFSRMIPEDYYGLLVAVSQTNEIKRDGDHQKMLFSQSVLEYPKEADETEPWHDVHPAVQQLKGFQEALKNERARFTGEA